MENADADSSEYFAANYCIGFVDLLGQRDALRGQGLLPTSNSVADGAAIDNLLRETVGPILRLQQDVEEMVQAISGNPDSPVRMSLSENERVVFDQMRRRRVKTQYWSDGVVKFVSLGDETIRCPLLGVAEILQLSGYFCLLGLARHRPVRGAIDISWGVEIPASGLCGPVVANAYELESEVAQYPRIVVGHRVVDFLKVHHANTSADPIARANCMFASLCLDMLLRDDDGHWIVHYLSHAFQFSVTHSNHSYLYAKARAFICEKLSEYRRLLNSKLAFRYSRLLNYFDSHPSSD